MTTGWKEMGYDNEKCKTCGKFITVEMENGEDPPIRDSNGDVWCNRQCFQEWEFNEEMDRMKEV